MTDQDASAAAIATAASAPAARPPRLTREQSRARTRERLLAAAAVVFTREGYAGASIDRIAEEAGYSKGAMYSNFASKDELFFAMFDYYALGQADELCRRLDAAGDADAIIATACAWADGMRHEPDLRLLVVDMARLARADAAVAARHTKMFDDEWHQVGSRLSQIFPDGLAPVPVLQLGALVMNIAYGHVKQLHGGLTAGDLIGVALRALRDAYGSWPAAAGNP
ncbi:TetR/AcrR family transcriptional regulator [Pseudoduganella umbonata]|uniref:AcrR family transcriptional regulator n=1 Tax=Pseudoduganella umbonata TaxID=864828 RepID=A0A4V1ED89_9BURK|nr:TetR/AcrR family transcriptional regulator [Pseudoduganella umbonata]MBB3221038.1 AcrR family transcriptional regulator [Pseudoduganella umbonata]QCP10241.1 TetR/AcrR family transcriptional regulator [Pseudoduganella umbonata]